jgi:hypothetical protein
MLCLIFNNKLVVLQGLNYGEIGVIELPLLPAL